MAQITGSTKLKVMTKMYDLIKQALGERGLVTFSNLSDERLTCSIRFMNGLGDKGIHITLLEPSTTMLINNYGVWSGGVGISLSLLNNGMYAFDLDIKSVSGGRFVELIFNSSVRAFLFDNDCVCIAQYGTSPLIICNTYTAPVTSTLPLPPSNTELFVCSCVDECGNTIEGALSYKSVTTLPLGGVIQVNRKQYFVYNASLLLEI